MNRNPNNVQKPCTDPIQENVSDRRAPLTVNTLEPRILLSATFVDLDDVGSVENEIDGTNGDDDLRGLELNDRIEGGAGDDFLKGLDGDDRIWGEEGADDLRGNAGNDVLYGGSGDDTLRGGQGQDFLTGGTGHDRLRGGAGDDSLYGEDGDDTLYGQSGNDRLSGRAGDDVLRGGMGEDTLYGGDGNDALRGGADNDKLYGSDGDDDLRGGSGDDRLSGGDGDDIILGQSGDDFVYGGAGKDHIRGGQGNDRLSAGSGNDVVRGGTGDDEIYGSEGEDDLRGGAGSDFVSGGDDNDLIRGNQGNDRLYGNQGDDVIHGGSGDDVIRGDSESVTRLSLNDQNLVKNGDFEIGPTGYQRSGSIPDWETPGGWEVLPASVYGQSNEGHNRVFELDVYEHVCIGQKLDGLSDGDEILLTFDVAQRVARTTEFDGVDVYWNGQLVDKIASLKDWRTYEFRLDADAGDGSHTLAFMGTGDSNSYGTILDNVKVQKFVANDVELDAGNDKLFGGRGNDLMYGNGGDDELRGGQGDDRVYGGDGDDLLVGGLGNDRLSGGSGDDKLRGGEGDDEMYGSDGDDELRGNRGQDKLYGGDGNDKLYGGADNDRLSAGAGDDLVFGGSGDDFVYGGAGNDILHGNTGNDRLSAGDGNDVLRGGRGDDELYGGDGDDDLRGNAGDDRLYGGTGDDRLHGGSGDDRLNGGSGDDILIGGSGFDTAIFTGSFSQYEISFNEDGTMQVVDLVAGRDGVDTLRDVEALRFSDGSFDVSELVAGTQTDLPASPDASDISNQGIPEAPAEDVPASENETVEPVIDGSVDPVGDDAVEQVQVDDVAVVPTTDPASPQETEPVRDESVESGEDDAVNVQEADDPAVVETNGTEEVVVKIDASNIESVEGVRVYGRRIDVDGNVIENADLVVDGTNIGVVGNKEAGVLNQIGFNPVNKISEQLVVEFDNPVIGAEISFSRLFPNEGDRSGAAGHEQGKWEAFKQGEVIASGTFVAEDGHSGKVTIDLPTGITADMLAFSATEYSGGQLGSTSDSSDYFINSICAKTTVPQDVVDTEVVVDSDVVEESVAPAVEPEVHVIEEFVNNLFVNDSRGNLARYNTETGEYTYIGQMGAKMTDISIAPDGRMFAISFSALYEVDPMTAETKLIGQLGRGDMNSLVFTPDGQLIAGGFRSSDLYLVDTDSGSLQSLGSVGAKSAGDLAIHEGDIMMATTDGRLLQIQATSDGRLVPETVGRISGATYGLASQGDDRLVAAKGTQLYYMDDDNAATKVIANLAQEGLSSLWGMSAYNEVVPSAARNDRTDWAKVDFGKLVEV